jgi:hypothetical protein
MAERRMFAKAVIGSGRFLRMPATARLLYYDLGMEADDDGVVEAFRVMRTTGANEDDLKILAARGLVRVLNNELVTLITDWKVNNYIQKDRYHRSVYANMLESMDTTCIQPVYNMDTSGIPSASEMDTEVREDKDRLDKSIDRRGETNAAAPAQKKTRKAFSPPTVEDVRAYCDENGLTTIDPEGFVDYYAANGWKVGNQPMKDWKATLRNWSRRDRERGITSKPAAKVQPAETSFETDSFFEASLARAYRNYNGEGKAME